MSKSKGRERRNRLYRRLRGKKRGNTGGAREENETRKG